MQNSWQEVVKLSQQYRYSKLTYWLEETLFTFNWWVLFVTTLGLFVVWIVILDKKRIFEILTFGFMVATITTLSDSLGLYLMLWEYNHTLTPLSIIVEIHVVQMPIIYMIIYQYFHTWKAFFIASTINAIFFAFMLEPLLVWLHVYEIYQWKHVYSFIPYIMIAVVLKYVIYKLK